MIYFIAIRKGMLTVPVNKEIQMAFGHWGMKPFYANPLFLSSIPTLQM